MILRGRLPRIQTFKRVCWCGLCGRLAPRRWPGNGLNGRQIDAVSMLREGALGQVEAKSNNQLGFQDSRALARQARLW